MMNPDNGMQAMELEPTLGHGDGLMKQQEQEPRARSPVEFCQSLCALIVAYALYYRTVSTTLGVIAFMVVIILFFDFVAYRSTMKTHLPRMQHDYSAINSLYALKMANVDHWCLFGDDDSCTCLDPNLPSPRGEVKGWAHAHRLNKDLAAAASVKDLNVVFVGDETIEALNGRLLGKPFPDGPAISNFFNKTLTKEGKTNIEGLALGIAGDSTSNAIWRLNHDEMPEYLDPGVWWISIGANDLAVGQCSEEVTVLGILRLAEELKTRSPGSIVVVNSILPRVSKRTKKHMAKKFLNVWPSIQVVNRALENYCSKHDHLEYFDATPLFITGSRDKKNGWDLKNLKKNLMSDQTEISIGGYKAWGKAIVGVLKELGAREEAVPEYDYDGSYLDDDFAFMDDSF